MKVIIFSISLFSLIIVSCSKDTGGSNSGGSTGGGGVIIPPRDTTPVVVPPPIVKTIYVDYFRFEFSNNNDTLRRAYFTNGVGNVVDLRLQYGTEASVKLNNFTDTAHDYTTYAGEFLRTMVRKFF